MITGDTQRRQFEQDVRVRVQRHLNDASVQLQDVRRQVEGATSEALTEIDVELDVTRAELEELARGVHPRILTEEGIAAALEALQTRSGLPIVLDVVAARLPATVEAAVYFLCSEATANAAKHARATQITIEVTVSNGQVTTVISDDGVGGADSSRGSGLRGLADRIEALGGTLTVRSEVGGGTRIRATLPFDRPSSPFLQMASPHSEP